jgi:hypothetical protein
MTTTWGPDRFDLPRVAYLMTVAAAAEDRARVDALWRPLDAAAQAAVLSALAAHWRQLLNQAAPGLSALARGQHFLTLLHAFCRDCCEPVRDFVLGALGALDSELSAPACRPCLWLAAQALCQAQLRFADAVGWPRQHLATIWRHPAT